MAETYPGNAAKDHVPAYRFQIRLTGIRRQVGRIELRVGNTQHVVMYAGHIGYRVNLPFRGRRFAARSCRLLFPLALRHGLNTLWITCNPDNIPSCRTCELLGGEFIEIVPLPPTTDMYRRGERFKCRYRIDLCYEQEHFARAR